MCLNIRPRGKAKLLWFTSFFHYTEKRQRFRYEATGQLTRFTDYADIKYRSRRVFSFHRPETLLALLSKGDTIRNNMKHFPAFDTTGFRSCQITAIQNLDASFADNRPKALVQMATGAGKTFTATRFVKSDMHIRTINRLLLPIKNVLNMKTLTSYFVRSSFGRLENMILTLRCHTERRINTFVTQSPLENMKIEY